MPRRKSAKRIAQELEIKERQKQAIFLRRGGASLRTIASKLGVSKDTIATDIKTVLAAAIEENVSDAESLRQLELERLDIASVAIYDSVLGGDLDAIHVWIRIIKSRRELYGLDVPVKQEIAATVHLIEAENELANEFERIVNRASADLAARDQSTDTE